MVSKNIFENSPSGTIATGNHTVAHFEKLFLKLL